MAGGMSRGALSSVVGGETRLAVVIWVAILWIVTAVLPSASALEVVVHPSQGQASVTRNALRAMFGMRLRTWPDGTPVKVFVFDNESTDHRQFSKRILGIFPHQLSQAWDRLVFSGTGQAPEVVDSKEEMLLKIGSTPGAIGYLPQAMIDDRVRQVDIPES